MSCNYVYNQSYIGLPSEINLILKITIVSLCVSVEWI